MSRSRLQITPADIESQLDYSPETGVFTRKKKTNQHAVGSVAGTLAASGARQIKLFGIDFMDFDLAWLLSYGQLPEGRVVQLDGDKSNCKLENLFDLRDGVMLTQEVLSILLRYDPETGVFTRRIATGSRSPVGVIVGCVNEANGYVVVGILGELQYAHRLAWLYVYGEWPSQQIDHINGVRDDNRIANLRDVSNALNCQNKREALSSNKSSGLLGVSWCAQMGAYAAYIHLDGKKKTIGYFSDKFVAHAAYVKEKRLLHPACTI